MGEFSIDPGRLARDSEQAAKRAAAGEGVELAVRLRAGERIDDIALTTLFLSPDVTTADLMHIARSRRPLGPPQVETFVPLYISNECDGECLMCGMRRGNRQLRRETADRSRIVGQLDTLHRRGMRGVAVLSGEYARGSGRVEMLERAAETMRDALDRSFTHVLINVGSFDSDEYPGFFQGVPRDGEGRLVPHVTMCTFQETYDPRVYSRFMGTSPGNPRSDFERRLRNFDRACDAGLRYVNPGLLLGLNPDLGYELLALCAHVRHLEQRGLRVYISVPRLRKASGAEHHRGASDDELVRLVALLATRFDTARVVISTRESPEIQHRLLPIIGVLTPVSPGFAPYEDAGARFEIEASQFDVADKRPFEAILDGCIGQGARLDGYEPATPKPLTAAR